MPVKYATYRGLLFVGLLCLFPSPASANTPETSDPERKPEQTVARGEDASKETPKTESGETNPEETKKISEEDWKKIEELAKDDEALKNLLTTLKDELKNGDEILLSIEELNDFLKTGAKPGLETIIGKIQDNIFKRLGISPVQKNARVALPKDTIAPRKFSFGEEDELYVTPQDLLPNEPITFIPQSAGSGPRGESCQGSCQRRGGGGGGSQAGGGMGSHSPLGLDPNGGRHLRGFDSSPTPVPIALNPFPPQELIPANLQGKKSFEFAAFFGNTTSRCQGTLFQGDPKNKSCHMATAGHCVTSNGRIAQQFNTAYGAFTAIRVRQAPNRNTVATDIAYVELPEATCKIMREEKVPELPLCENPLRNGQMLRAETRYFGKPIWAEVRGILGTQLSVNVNFKEGNHHQGGLHTGDSGGGVVYEMGASSQASQACLAGVLSAAEQPATVHRTRDGRPTVGSLSGFYSTDLAFLKEESKKARPTSQPSSELLAVK